MCSIHHVSRNAAKCRPICQATANSYILKSRSGGSTLGCSATAAAGTELGNEECDGDQTQSLRGYKFWRRFNYQLLARLHSSPRSSAAPSRDPICPAPHVTSLAGAVTQCHAVTQLAAVDITWSHESLMHPYLFSSTFERCFTNSSTVSDIRGQVPKNMLMPRNPPDVIFVTNIFVYRWMETQSRAELMSTAEWAESGSV